MALTTGLLPKMLGGPAKPGSPAEPLTEEGRKLLPKRPLAQKRGMAFGKKNKRLAYVPPEKQ